MKKRTVIFILALPALAALTGCGASVPPFDCDAARAEIAEAEEEAKEHAQVFHIAEAEKDAGYYLGKGVRGALCLGTLGLGCDAANQLLDDNARIEQTSEEAELRYAQLAQVANVRRRAMEDNDCDDIPAAAE